MLYLLIFINCTISIIYYTLFFTTLYISIIYYTLFISSLSISIIYYTLLFTTLSICIIYYTLFFTNLCLLSIQIYSLPIHLSYHLLFSILYYSIYPIYSTVSFAYFEINDRYTYYIYNSFKSKRKRTAEEHFPLRNPNRNSIYPL